MLFGIFAVVYVVAFVLTPSEASWAGALGLDDDGEFSRPYTVISLITGLALYLMAYVGYIAGVYVAADRSMSVRIMIELVLAGGRAMSKDEIRGVYNLDGFYDRRFDDLIYGGYIVEAEPGRYRCTLRGRLVGGFYRRYIRWLGLRGG
jgi:hypothetical protein